MFVDIYMYIYMGLSEAKVICMIYVTSKIKDFLDPQNFIISLIFYFLLSNIFYEYLMRIRCSSYLCVKYFWVKAAQCHRIEQRICYFTKQRALFNQNYLRMFSATTTCTPNLIEISHAVDGKISSVYRGSRKIWNDLGNFYNNEVP